MNGSIFHYNYEIIGELNDKNTANLDLCAPHVYIAHVSDSQAHPALQQFTLSLNFSLVNKVMHIQHYGWSNVHFDLSLVSSMIDKLIAIPAKKPT